MAAPKFNFYTLGREDGSSHELVNEENPKEGQDTGGRPRKFATPEAFEERVIAYFDFCIEKKMEVTVNGLALFMGFYDKTGLKNYVNYEGFLPPLKRALACVELSYELDLRTFKFGGAVFALKNMGWIDEQHSKVDADIKNEVSGEVTVTLNLNGEK